MEYYYNFHGEIQKGKNVDKTLREYFPDYNYRGIFFDIGAYEPINISNSYHFEKNGWDCYCFEANLLLINELKKYRKNVYNYAVYDENKDVVEFNVVNAGFGGGSGTAGISSINLDSQYLETFGNSIKNIIKINVVQKTLNTILETEILLTKRIDILQIDVEGGELKVLQGFNIKLYNPRIILVEDIFDNKELHDYIISNGYVLDKHIDYNKYYISNTFND